MSDWDVIGLVHAPAMNEEEDANDIIISDEFTDSVLSGSVGEISSAAPMSQTDPSCQEDYSPSFGRRRRDARGRNRAADFNGKTPESKAVATLQDQNHYSYTSHALSEIIGSEEQKAPEFVPSKRRSSMRRGDKRNFVPSETTHRFGHVSQELLQDGKFNQAKYDRFRMIAIGERAANGIGLSSEMNSLYYFWCYFLRKNFNEDMYKEFLQLSKLDNKVGSHYGIECFFRMCSYGLETNWNEEVFRDFEAEAINDYNNGSKYGIEKMLGFILNQKLGFEIPVSPEMKKLLDKYPTFESLKDGTEKPQPFKLPKGKKSRQPISPGGRSMPKHSAMFDPASAPKQTPFAPQESPLKEQPKPEQPKAQPSQPPRNTRRQPFGKSRGRNKRYNEPGEIEWAFGSRVQPSSAPNDSPMHKKW
jgi:hypothetical protein